jgi:pimeloyl-ACP methyl ester carboxylesterase
MTHSRSLQQVLAPRKQRSVNCHEVIKDSDKVFGSLPKFIIGHSMGGADTASVIAHYLRSGSSGNVVAAGFDSSVGLNGRIPGLGNGIQFLRQEVLTAGGLSGERKRMMLSTFDNYAQNPLLAAAEAFLASTADIKADVDMIQTHMPTLEIFSQFDYLIPPPTNRPGSVVRPEASLGHLALCVEPEVAYEDVALLLDKVV